MAIFCLTESWADLAPPRRTSSSGTHAPATGHRRRPRGRGRDGGPVPRRVAPNLGADAEGAPAFVHGGPFANIAHGCSSVMATRSPAAGRHRRHRGGIRCRPRRREFVDIKCRLSGLRPDVAVVVATVRAEVPRRCCRWATSSGRIRGCRGGMVNLRRHLQQHPRGGASRVVAVNRFPSDTDRGRQGRRARRVRGASASPATHVVDGGTGARTWRRCPPGSRRPVAVRPSGSPTPTTWRGRQGRGGGEPRTAPARCRDAKARK